MTDSTRSHAHERLMTEQLTDARWPTENQEAVDVRRQMIAALPLLCIDEAAVLSRFIARAYLSCGYTSTATFAIAGFMSRLLKGRRAYGALDVATDGRDWYAEMCEELADAAVYHEIDGFVKPSGTKIDYTRGVDERMFAGLVLVGKRCNLDELADDVRHA